MDDARQETTAPSQVMPETTFDLSTGDAMAAGRPVRVTTDAPVGYLLLHRNAVWFTKLRWIVVAAFLAISLVNLTGVTHRIGLNLGTSWMLVLAAILTGLNLACVWHCSRLGTEDTRSVKANLWCQIVGDLLALSVVVHQVGSYDTFAPFLFMVHITLACIFLSRRSSLVVVLLASVLYAGEVMLEYVGVIDKEWVFAGMRHAALPPTALAVHVGSAILLWIVIWVLVAELATKLRQRQREVLEAQERTLRTFKEAQSHMRHTSHQMKAPLDAIRSNVSLMCHGYAGELSPKSRELLGRIEARCNALSAFVADVLHLAHLKAGEELSAAREHVRLDTLLHDNVEALRNKALTRGIAIHLEADPVTVWGDRDALAMLLDNLLTNAINYSHDGGVVTATCKLDEQQRPIVTVTDRGIGIAPDKLNRIFDEYYRTSEAKRHNPHSTGVGLTIVREVATTHAIRVQVRSQLGAGTSFILAFPIQ